MTAAMPMMSLSGLSEPGLRKLVLPMPDQAFEDCGGGRHECRGWADECRTAPRPADEAGRALYRWLLGHHVAFCVWRLISESISDLEKGLTTAADGVGALYDAYSALLLYSGSCTPEAYHTSIRPAMIAQHPSFSGTWARDYEPIPARIRSLPRSSTTSSMKAAVRFNRLVHIAVAARLVPGGASLLRESGRTTHQAPTENERELLDAFFQTVRGPICAHGLLGQLRQRTRLITDDLSRFPLSASYERDPINRFQELAGEHIDRATTIAETIVDRWDQLT